MQTKQYMDVKTVDKYYEEIVRELDEISEQESRLPQALINKMQLVLEKGNSAQQAEVLNRFGAEIIDGSIPNRTLSDGIEFFKKAVEKGREPSKIMYKRIKIAVEKSHSEKLAVEYFKAAFHMGFYKKALWDLTCALLTEWFEFIPINFELWRNTFFDLLIESMNEKHQFKVFAVLTVFIHACNLDKEYGKALPLIKDMLKNARYLELWESKYDLQLEAALSFEEEHRNAEAAKTIRQYLDFNPKVSESVVSPSLR